MKSKAQDIMLKLLLGAGGIVVVAMAWLRPMPLPEMIIGYFIGFSGFCGVLVWSIVSMSPRAGKENGIASANVDIKD